MRIKIFYDEHNEVHRTTEKIFEIAEFKMKVEILDSEVRNDFLEIAYRNE